MATTLRRGRPRGDARDAVGGDPGPADAPASADPATAIEAAKVLLREVRESRPHAPREDRASRRGDVAKVPAEQAVLTRSVRTAIGTASHLPSPGRECYSRGRGSKALRFIRVRNPLRISLPWTSRGGHPAGAGDAGRAGVAEGHGGPVPPAHGSPPVAPARRGAGGRHRDGNPFRPRCLRPTARPHPGENNMAEAGGGRGERSRRARGQTSPPTPSPLRRGGLRTRSAPLSRRGFTALDTPPLGHNRPSPGLAECP